MSGESDAGVQLGAAGTTNIGTGKSPPDTGTQDASTPAQDPPPASEAAGGSAAAAGGAGAPSLEAGSGGAPGASGAPAPTTNKQVLIELLNERAGMNGTDALLVRTLVAQLDTPFPVSSGSLRLLLTTAVTSFGCPARNPQQCTTICNYVGDTCLTCVSDPECRDQLVLVCPNALSGCLTLGR